MSLCHVGWRSSGTGPSVLLESCYVRELRVGRKENFGAQSWDLGQGLWSTVNSVHYLTEHRWLDPQADAPPTRVLQQAGDRVKVMLT